MDTVSLDVGKLTYKNGNELSNTASYTYPDDMKLRQTTFGSINGENAEGGTDSLTRNNYPCKLMDNNVYYC